MRDFTVELLALVRKYNATIDVTAAGKIFIAVGEDFNAYDTITPEGFLEGGEICID